MQRLQYYVDIETSAGVKQGSGPCTAVVYWESQYAMDRAGVFACGILLADPQSAYLVNENVLRCYAVIDSAGPTFIGSGVIDDIRYTKTPAGIVVNVVGIDECRYLMDKTVGFTQFGGSGSPPTISHATAVSALAAFMSGWTFTADASVPFDAIIYRYTGESVLQAIIQLADFCKTHWYLSAAKTITFKSVFTSSGVTAIDAPVQGLTSNANIVRISSFEYKKETKDLMNAIRPYGGWYNGVFTDEFITAAVDVNYGLGGGDPDLWPSPKYAGYSDDRTNNWIYNDASVAIYGQRQKQVQYPQVKVTFTTGGYSNEIWRDLCRLIYNKAVADLIYFGVEAEFYTLKLENCPVILRPLQTIRVMINTVENGRVVFKKDATMLITNSTVEITGQGLRTTSVEVSTAERYRRSDPYATVDQRYKYFLNTYQ